jgi:hypothetical protein
LGEAGRFNGDEIAEDTKEDEEHELVHTMSKD